MEKDPESMSAKELEKTHQRYDKADEESCGRAEFRGLRQSCVTNWWN